MGGILHVWENSDGAELGRPMGAHRAEQQSYPTCWLLLGCAVGIGVLGL